MAQTSLIPTVISLSDFFASNFPNISWYPNWYLGNSYNYLIGPVVPILLSLISKILPFSFLQIYLAIVFSSIFSCGLGIYLLLKSWGVEKKEAMLSGIIYVLFPGSFYLLYYQNGLNHIAFGFLPFVLILFRKFLNNQSKLLALFLGLFVTFLLLIDISILLGLIIGIISIFALIRKEKCIQEKIVSTVLILIFGFFFASSWYTLKFWWVLLSNPSFGGVPLFNLIISLFKLLLNLFPIAFAIIVVKWRKYKPKNHVYFALLFFSSFFFLTTARFLSDPDFVIDWISFFLELQFGAAILLGAIAGKFRVQSLKSKVTVQSVKYFALCAILIILTASSSVLVFKGLLENNKEYEDRIVSVLRKNVGENERIFLSGSPVFFANKVNQVRGGADQAAIHPSWAMAAYQIREGRNKKTSKDWLVALGTSYVLVHTKDSKEIFHDFKSEEKFKTKDFKLIRENSGDILYKIDNATIARIADLKILGLQSPRSGEDKLFLNQYISSIKNSSNFKMEEDEIKIKVNLKTNEVFSLAITYDPAWKIKKGEGKLVSDPLGNMVIVPKKDGEQEFLLEHKMSFFWHLMPLVLSFITALVLIKNSIILRLIKKKLPNIALGINEDDDY